MKKKILALVMILSILLCGCGDDTPKSDSGTPGRMVRSIEVAIQPENPEYEPIIVKEAVVLGKVISLVRYF